MQIKLLPLLLALSLLLSLQACTGNKKFDVEQVNFSLTPQSVLAEQNSSLGKLALWGGTILDTRNLKDSTQVEVLAYPLDSSHRPLLDKKPLGRFIIKHKDYLEPANYAQGRQLSVVGKVANKQSGKVGEQDYAYPVLISQQLHLWSAEDSSSKTNFHFGIGIGIRN